MHIWKIKKDTNDFGGRHNGSIDDFKQFIKCCKSEVVGPEFTEPIEEREAYLIARGRGHIICDELRKAWQDEIDKYKDINQEKVLLN